MNKITFPLKPGMQGPGVADLQDALQLCLDRAAILTNDEASRRELSAALKPERGEQVFGKVTQKLVHIFQDEQHIQSSGEIDEPIANALNALLKVWGMLDQPTEPATPQSFAVSGQVRREEGQPLEGLRVRAIHEANAGSVRLGEDTTDAEGRYTIRYEMLPGVDSVNLRVTSFDADGKPLRDSDVIRGAKPLEIVDLIVPGVKITPYRVEGKVASRASAGVGGLRVVIIDKGVGSDAQLAEASTDEGGTYQVTFSDSEVRRRGKMQPDLQARVFIGDAFLGASDVHYNASQHETLNVLLDDKASSALQSEHEALTGALSCQFKGKLGDLKETDEQQDITYLANKTGWDARAVALAALADQFSARTIDDSGTPAIPQAFFYALFRAGLPANEDTLYHTDARMLEGVWKKAAEQGVIPRDSVDQIQNLVGRFQTLSAIKLLTGPALIGASSLQEMLAVAGLDDSQRVTFAQLYTANRADMDTFWKAVGDAFGQEKANRLQVDGKLAFLTINNAPLMQKVHTTVVENGLSNPLQLAQAGYHRAEPWNQLLASDIPIPKEIPGDTPETRRANYADYLAAQVRLSYPTAAVAEMINNTDPNLRLTFAGQNFSNEVFQFLTEHEGEFEIGVQPVEQYIAENKLNLNKEDETVKQIKQLQRVYQITPSDQAMRGLLKRGIDAAYHVVRYDKDTFVQSFADDLGGADQAAQTYNRSVQIHNAVLNIALSYQNARIAPPIGVPSLSIILDPTPANTGDVIAYATLESLFGSMDFCACDHCRSILSPAAYLVDLLLFLQSDSEVWADFLKTWKQTHANTPYPFVDQNAWQKFQSDWKNQYPGQALPNTEISPFDVLMSRRPDIEYLPLTCENTNTALPYIDVVNETLEYYIANGLSLEKRYLDGYQGHDTNGIASEDLLASPQFVLDSAYTTLRNECFPIPLPFHHPLENLRRYFNKFEVPLPLAMERLRKNDDLERGANLYGWRDILMEEIGISRDEYEILTNSTAVPLWQMCGFPNGKADAEVIAGLSNAKQFARRVGISYEDLISILKTRFINPNSDLIPKLDQLGVNFAMLAELKTKNDGPTDANFDALLTTLAVPPEPAMYGGDIKAWVKNDDNYARIMGLITLTIPVGIWTASQVYAIGDCVQPTAAKAESTLYYECTASGTSAATEPIWPTTPGNTCNDGTVVWTCRDASSCLSFDNLAFRYADPAKITQNIGVDKNNSNPAFFVRLLRFIRLWKKLGWTIEQTDAAICALYRTDLAPLDVNDINDVTELDTGFLTLLLRIGIIIRVMKALTLTVNRDLLPLLACWSYIGTHSDNSLYRQMFLNPALLKQDAVFADNSYGEFLQRADVPYSQPRATLEQAIIVTAHGRIGYNDSTRRLFYVGVLDAATRDALKAVPKVSPAFQQAVDDLYRAQRLATHAEALRSAFNLTGDEYDRITDTLSYNDNTALTIPNISAIFRRGWLARKLRLSVRELLLLIQLTGLDPFAAPDLTNPAILRLIELVQSLKDRSFTSASALYLIWNQDLSGKSAPDAAQITELARTLRGDFASIENQFAITEDPGGDIARSRVALVYGQEVADTFFALLDDTLVLDEACTHPTPTLDVDYIHPTLTLDVAITSVDSQIAYDDSRHRLLHIGLLSVATRDALRSVTGVTTAFTDAVDALFNLSEYAKDQLTPTLYVSYIHPTATLDAAITSADSQIAYDLLNHRLLHIGLLSPATRDALKSVAGVTTAFKDAVDALFDRSEDVKTHPMPTLYIAITSTDNRIAYDDFRHRLLHTGLLSQDMRDKLKSVAGITTAFTDAVEALFDRSEDMKGAFFTRYPELKPLFDAYSNSTDPPATKRAALLAAFQPELARRRKSQQAMQRLSAVANTNLAFTQALMDAPTAPFPLHAAGLADQSALNDVLALETPGLAVQFFFRDTATGNVDQSDPSAANLAYASSGGNPLPNPPNAISGIWSGLVETPEAGYYNFIIEVDSGATVGLKLGGQTVHLEKNGNIYRNTESLELKAGTLYEIVLAVEKVKDSLSLKWETPKRAREVIPSRYLYPPTTLASFSSVYIRFLKTVSLTMGLSLTSNEMTYFANHADYRINAQGQIDSNGQGWLNALPSADNLHLTNSADAAVAKNLNAALLTPLRALLDFARIKGDISPSDECLLKVLKDPVAAAQDPNCLLFTIARWNQTSLNDVLGQFGSSIAKLGHFDLFRRVYDAFALIQKMGISAKALIQATTNDPTGDTIRDLQAALRARYDHSDWRDVVRPINDEMRGLQRDALVAYILHQMRSDPASSHIDTADKLFEYFLMDVQMDPCMQTSRIRHALSSVQLFIERCLMNLEPRVSPAAINAKQWEWMKRYRVWEANRKVYLFPENWLEPELREDKSPFFKEIESELLQSDITEDSAATALLNYLSKLEEVAKLEPCGIYYIPADSSKRTGEISHVIARTAGAHRKYYYRRYEGNWTPWEQIKLDIEDNPVIPVVWKDRLFLFWLRILKQAPLATPDLSEFTSATSINPSQLTNNNRVKVDVHAVLCWSEYYNGKWQPTKTSNVSQPLSIDDFDLAVDPFDRANLMMRSSVGESEELLIHVGYPGRNWKYFVLYNTHSLPLQMEWNLYISGGENFRILIKSEIQKILGPSAAVEAVEVTTGVLDELLTPIIMQIQAGIRVSTLQEIQAQIKSRLIKNIKSRLEPTGYKVADLIASKLPDILSRLITPQLLRYRDIDFQSDLLSSRNYDLSITTKPLSRFILKNPIRDGTIEPHHPLQDPWEAPFFYEDSRHVFYVTTTEQPVWILDNKKFGIQVDLGGLTQEMSIPPLVLQTDTKVKSKPKSWDDGMQIVINPGVVDSAPMERFVTEDVYIRRGIGTTAAVTFGDMQIGPSGAIVDGRSM